MSSPSPTPLIRSKRLIIRPPTVEDAAGVTALFANPATTEFEPHKPTNVTVPGYTERIKRWATMREKGDNCMMIVVKPGSENGEASDNADKVIGFGGVNGYKTEPDGRRIADIGVMIDSSEWRKGYGKEAFIATADYCLGEAGCDGISFQTMAANAPFRALIRAMRLESEEVVLHNGDFEECDYTISKARWEEAMRI